MYKKCSVVQTINSDNKKFENISKVTEIHFISYTATLRYEIEMKTKIATGYDGQLHNQGQLKSMT